MQAWHRKPTQSVSHYLFQSCAAFSVVQAQASNMLLDRGWGKPAQTANQNIDEKRSATDWSQEELVAFLNDGVGR